MRFNTPLKTVMVLTLLAWPAVHPGTTKAEDTNDCGRNICDVTSGMAEGTTSNDITIGGGGMPAFVVRMTHIIGGFTNVMLGRTENRTDMTIKGGVAKLNNNAKIKGDMTIKGGVANVMAEGTQRAVEWSPTTKTDVALLMGSFGTTLTDKFIAKTPALTRKYKEIPYAGYLEMEHTKKIKLDYLNAIDATAKEKNGSRTITGVTIGGNYRTIHCNPKNCTVGSLNRFSILSGAPMMVPKTMYDAAALELSGADLPVDRAGIWKTVASITWSEDFAKEDVNAASARTRHLADPTAYGKAQTALKTEQVKGDRKLVLNTIIAKTQGDITEDVTVSENDDLVVVTETVVTCTSQGQTDCVDAHDQ